MSKTRYIGTIIEPGCNDDSGGFFVSHNISDLLFYYIKYEPVFIPPSVEIKINFDGWKMSYVSTSN